MVHFYGESGKVVNDWNELGDERVNKIEVFLFPKQTGLPYITLERYDKYMYQKYATMAMVGGGMKYDKYRGFQIGGYKEGVGWVVVNIDFPSSQIKVTMANEITSISIKEGVK